MGHFGMDSCPRWKVTCLQVLMCRLLKPCQITRIWRVLPARIFILNALRTLFWIWSRWGGLSSLPTMTGPGKWLVSSCLSRSAMKTPTDAIRRNGCQISSLPAPWNVSSNSWGGGEKKRQVSCKRVGTASFHTTSFEMCWEKLPSLCLGALIAWLELLSNQSN